MSSPQAACASCGAPLAPGVKFCRKCGAQVQSRAASGPPTGPSQPQPKVTTTALADANSFARDKLKRGDSQANVTSQLVASGIAPDLAGTIVGGASLELLKEGRRAWRGRGGRVMAAGIIIWVFTLPTTLIFRYISTSSSVPQGVTQAYVLGDFLGGVLVACGIAGIAYSYTRVPPTTANV